MIEINELSRLIQNQDDEVQESLFKNGFKKGLNHYRSHYLWTLITTLQNNYPTVVSALSENNFNYFARKYIISEGSSSENLDDFGKSFAGFLDNQEELVEATVLTELAKIDWLLVERFMNQENYVKAPKGTLKFWQAIQAHEDLSQLNIETESVEFISLGFEDNDFYLYTQEVK